ncbi:MAG: phytanoyl-CoA dioxygenase family protein [Burkholderiaceae bacterium]
MSMTTTDLPATGSWSADPDPNDLPLPRVSASALATEDPVRERYRAEGTRRALALDNRGPLRITADGRLEPAILDAYWRHGFYVFQAVVGREERHDMARDVADLLERAPLAPGGRLDRHGRPALGADCQGRNVSMVKPLSDPYGGSAVNHGRHPARMHTPEVPEGAPDYVMQLLLGPLQHSIAHLRLYGHPALLTIAASVNGDDFVPFNESLWIKAPRLGGSVAWHQDGWTHWDSPTLDAGTHGFNLMMQLYGCDAANGLWVVPGTHDQGRVDIAAMVAAAGSDMLPDAVPLICDPGDVVICNRQVVHGSFANTSDRIRVTMNCGFHRRASVLGVRSGGVHNPVALYDEAYIAHRARIIGYAIDARRQRFANEQPFDYRPLADAGSSVRWDEAARADMHDYNLFDMGI